MDTIYAVASGRVKAGVTVIRISGPQAFSAAEILSGPLPEPRRTGLRRLRDPDGGLIDEALVVCFAAGASFTGELVVELHVHGSLAVVSSVLRELGGIDGLRPADAGEFSRRALENDRLDPTQIEGMADLIEAETEAQRRQALRVFAGDLGKKVALWRSDLIRAAALTEATIDFADEDIPQDVMPEVRLLLARVNVALNTEIAGAAAAERIRDGFEVAIIGRPNVGKSTLLNALAGRDAAITSEFAGTTRDIIEVRMDLGGLPVTLLDTAGLRDTLDPVEALGVERATRRAQGADLRLVILNDPDEAPGLPVRDGDLLVLGKSDQLNHRHDMRKVSGLTGEGIGSLLEEIGKILQARASGAATITRQRHLAALVAAVRALDSARNAVDEGGVVPEVVAADLRSCVRALEGLIGRVGVEDYLEEIFSSFCIGK